MTQRIVSFDLLKCFAIFLVVWGHSIQYFVEANYENNIVWKFIYAFHMPLFMMISGFFSFKSISLSTDFRLFLKKGRELLLPSFVWTFFFVVYACYLNRNSIDGAFFDSQIVPILSVKFWFLKTCFVCYLMTWLGYHFPWSKFCGVVIMLFLSQLIPYVAHLDVMFPCFLVGFGIKYNNNVHRFIVKNFVLSGILFLGLFLLKENMPNLECFLLKLLIGILGGYFFIGLFEKIFRVVRNGKVVKICSYIGKHTLEIYILQVVIVETILPKYLKIGNGVFILTNFVYLPLISIVLVIVCLGLANMISRFSFFNLILFGKNKISSLNSFV